VTDPILAQNTEPAIFN